MTTTIDCLTCGFVHGADTPHEHKRKRRDPVTAGTAEHVLERDRGCIAVLLGANPADCRPPLTLDHVKDQPRMGLRAPSDRRHLVSICAGHHLDTGWATSHRPDLRAYLASVEP